MDILKNVNLNLLKSFWAVYKTGGINRAARLLDMTPPSLSHNIKQLERQLGKTLFKTHKKGADPTADATTLFSLVEIAFENLQKFNEQFAANKGVIRIGLTTICASFFLVNFVREFQSKYPDIKLEYHHHPTHDYLGMVENDEVDVGIMAFTRKPKEGINVFSLFKNNMTFFATRGYAEKHNLSEEITVEQLVKLPVILFSAKVKEVRNILENDVGQKLNAVEYHTTHTAFDRTMQGQGIGFFFEDYIDAQKTNEIMKIRVKDVELTPWTYECATNKNPSALVSLFIKEMKIFFKS